jgi:F-type H+-transporting ATPase subunit b
MIQAPDFSLILIFFIFGIAYAILTKFLFRPIGEILDWREGEERSSRKVYDETRAEMDAALARIEEGLSLARREGLKTRESLRAEGRTIFDEKLAAAREEARVKIEEAATAIDAQARRAREELPQKAGSLARELAARILGRPVAA